MLTVTALVSLAVPLNVGDALLDGDFGCVNVTVGGVVSTMNTTGVLVPSGLPNIELFCEAIAVYVCFPLCSAGLAAVDVHASPAGAAVASATTVPLGRSPS